MKTAGIPARFASSALIQESGNHPSHASPKAAANSDDKDNAQDSIPVDAAARYGFVKLRVVFKPAPKELHFRRTFRRGAGGIPYGLGITGSASACKGAQPKSSVVHEASPASPQQANCHSLASATL